MLICGKSRCKGTAFFGHVQEKSAEKCILLTWRDRWARFQDHLRQRRRESFSLFAAIETHPTSGVTGDNAIVGESYTIDGTYVAGAGNTKVGAMPDKGVKLRINKKVNGTANAFEFKVNAGYAINGITLVGITNTADAAATVGSILVDGAAWNGTFDGALPAKNADAASNIAISDINARESVVFVFSELGGASQANICYTVEYTETRSEVSRETTISGALINGYAIPEDKVSDLQNTHEATLDSSYLEAPEVTFILSTEILYDDESTKTVTEEKVVNAALVGDEWQALTIIENQLYTLKAAKIASVRITYFDATNGTVELGYETVVKGGTAADYEKYQNMPMSEFKGWYSDANLSDPIDLSAYVFNDDKMVFALYEKTYATSLNIEQLVLDKGTGAAKDSILTAHGFAFQNIDALDSLNEAKDNRNYSYLGLKIKKEDAFVAFILRRGSVAKIRFGNVGADFKLVLNADAETLTADKANATAEDDNKVEIEAANSDVAVSITSISDKTLVIKQIMIDEEIAAVVLPESTQGIEDIDASVKAVKRIENGMLIIEKNGKFYNVLGIKIK